MALINCPECTKEISDQCSACPHCGFPLQKYIQQPETHQTEAQSKNFALIGILIFTVIITIVVAFVLISDPLMIQDSKYEKAITLMEAGKYDEAILVFEALDDYKDSKKKITECETKILDEKYHKAVALMEAGQYAEAITIFEALGDYSDAKKQAIRSWGVWNPIAAGINFTAGLRKDGTVVAAGWNEFGQCNVSSWRNIVAIAAGDHNCYYQQLPWCRWPLSLRYDYFRRQWRR